MHFKIPDMSHTLCLSHVYGAVSVEPFLCLRFVIYKMRIIEHQSVVRRVKLVNI